MVYNNITKQKVENIIIEIFCNNSFNFVFIWKFHKVRVNNSCQLVQVHFLVLLSANIFAINLNKELFKSFKVVFTYKIYNAIFRSAIWRKNLNVSWYFSNVFILLECLSSSSWKIFLIRSCSFETPKLK